jgi:UDP-N-acetylmuramate--alanine ligase
MYLKDNSIVNKNIESFKTIHVIGISGIGLSALSHILDSKNIKISGSTNAFNKQTEKLQNKGIQINLHDANNLQNPDLVIITQEIPKDNPELKKALELNIPVVTYPQAVGMLLGSYKKVISISGTHGKSTSTAMLVTILHQLNIPFNAIIGTDVVALGYKNYHIDSNSEIFVIEACEYMDAFLNYNPYINLTTNKQYLESFQNLFNKSQYNILNSDYKLALQLNRVDVTYKEKESTNLKLAITGNHNRTNALGVKHVCGRLGISEEQFNTAIQAFTHSARRMEVVKQTDTQIIYTDYGHHPTEIKVTLQALREKHPDASICLFFQPHQYSRTIQTLGLFKDAFLNADKVVITDIYDARDTKQDKEAMNTSKLIDTINHENIHNGISVDNCKQNFDDITKNHDIVMVMGAGDITKMIDYY